MAFIGPHQGPKILGKNHQSTTKVTLNEPPINVKNITSFSGNVVVLVYKVIRDRSVCWISVSNSVIPQEASNDSIMLENLPIVPK